MTDRTSYLYVKTTDGQDATYSEDNGWTWETYSTKIVVVNPHGDIDVYPLANIICYSLYTLSKPYREEEVNNNDA